MNTARAAEALRSLPADLQPNQPTGPEGLGRWIWESRFGSMLIEVVGEAVFVNGQLVEPHRDLAVAPAAPAIRKDS
jgi:hypothetical protein